MRLIYSLDRNNVNKKNALGLAVFLLKIVNSGPMKGQVLRVGDYDGKLSFIFESKRKAG